MKRNDILKVGDDVFRVLEVENDNVCVINCHKRTMPKTESQSFFDNAELLDSFHADYPASKKVSPKPKTKVATKPMVSHTTKTATNTANKKSSTRKTHTTVKAPVTHTNTKPQEYISSTPIRLFEYPEPKATAPVVEPPLIL